MIFNNFMAYQFENSPWQKCNDFHKFLEKIIFKILKLGNYLSERYFFCLQIFTYIMAYTHKSIVPQDHSKLNIFHFMRAWLDFLIKLWVSLKKNNTFFQRLKTKFCYIEKLPIHLRNTLYEIDFSFRSSKKVLFFLTRFFWQKLPKSYYFV